MVAQSESEEMFREYYGDIALMLRTPYIIATADYDEDSDFVLTMIAENHNLTSMPSVQEESIYQPSVQCDEAYDISHPTKGASLINEDEFEENGNVISKAHKLELKLEPSLCEV